MDHCPAGECWMPFLEGRLEAEESRELEGHLERCAACQETVARLTEDEALGRWRQLVRPYPAPAEFRVDTDRLRRLLAAPDPAEPPISHQARSAAIRFPGPKTAEAPLGQLGVYGIVRLLGAGSTGIVFEAFDVQLRRPVAIKVLQPELAVSLRSRARFEREARAAVAVSHPHIVTIHGVGRTEGFPLPYLVMEYVAGASLAERCAGASGCPPRCGPAHRPGGVGTGPGARARTGAPRRQAREHPHRARDGTGQARGFRDRACNPRRGRRGDGAHHQHRPHRRHPALHESRAGAGPAGRCPHRRLRSRRDPL